jgi:hypothetical protein
MFPLIVSSLLVEFESFIQVKSRGCGRARRQSEGPKKTKII